MNKQDLRKQCLERRKRIEEKEIKSKTIIEEILLNPLYQNSSVIALYNSIDSEVSTKELIRTSLLLKKVLLLPKIEDNRMIFIRIDASTKYKESSYHIKEPIGEEYLGNIDLMIVPGVAFTKEGKRLGYGGGYYDKYLEGKNIKTIGLSFEEQILEDIPLEEHDQVLDYIQTEERLYQGIKSNKKII